jgi:hypothetical protein
MKNTLLSLIILLSNAIFVHSQKIKSDTLNPFGFHLGVNFGAGNAGGTFGGGGLKVCPRIGVHYKERLVLGLESNSEYQIVYRKDTLMEPSISLSKWAGPFARYYFYPAQSKLNLVASFNYVFGSYYVWSENEKFRKTYNTAILGLGFSFKVKKAQVEFGYRYTFQMNNTPSDARYANTFFLGLTRNF